ncbi:hypothetical protein C9374_000697 [Naegleria lovaniensis]|uniref:Uncharacterized protein n=1 Tax=Naegleria lovaniensis TaxID=51637 RepID=A0AA88GY62_NAELO|nr:uncharacterized protein C9374_000697 [Naegleria lovaniensis]KAG2388533.1 hypothetical protein C9374_000697 [Naegleria lovaniensis]
MISGVLLYRHFSFLIRKRKNQAYHGLNSVPATTENNNHHENQIHPSLRRNLLLQNVIHQHTENITLAILVPFRISDVRNIISNWNGWESQHYPCSETLFGQQSATATYILHYDFDIEKLHPQEQKEWKALLRKISVLTRQEKKMHSVADVLKSVWNRLPKVSHCFKNLVIKSAHSEFTKNHAELACQSFYNGFDMVRKLGYDYMYFMEASVRAIREFWLDQLFEQILTRRHNNNEGRVSDFWQRGSVNHCHQARNRMASRKDYRINRNALYFLKDENFVEYVNKAHEHFPVGNGGVQVKGCSTGSIDGVGPDAALFDYRMQPVHWSITSNTFHKFQYSDFFLNFCEEPIHLEDLLRDFTNTYLIQSKFIEWTPERKLFSLLYRELTENKLHLVPNKEEHKPILDYIRMIMNNESGNAKRSVMEMLENHEYLVYLLCSTARYLNFFKLAGHSALHPLCIKICYKNQNLAKLLNEKAPGFCEPYSDVADEKWKKSSLNNKLYLWTSDFHAAPIGCNMNILSEVGIETHAEIDYENCRHFPGTCKTRLKVLSIDGWKGVSLDPCPNKIRRDFFHAYRNDPEMQRVDAVICSHPVANCELYLPFNKSLIVYATTRLEFGRNDRFIDWRKPYFTSANTYRWISWVKTLQKIAANPRNIIAANNKYDAEYISYHTGLKVEYIPSWCGDFPESTKYNPVRTEILLGPYRDNLNYPSFDEQIALKHPIMTDLSNAAAKTKTKLTFVRMRIIYPQYSISDLASHPAIVLIPYQVSVMSFFEYYRLNIPLFVPSLSLMIKWQLEHNNMWERVYGDPERVVKMDDGIPSPYENSKASLEYWLKYSDYYTFPHIQTFDNFEDLIYKIENSDLKAISDNMKVFNAKQREELKATWTKIKNNILHYSGGSFGNSKMPRNIEEGLNHYGIPPLGVDFRNYMNQMCEKDEHTIVLRGIFNKEQLEKQQQLLAHLNRTEEATAK